MEEKALRYNEEKLRYDLLEPFAIEELVKVFTFGSKKYEDNNWLKGFKWTTILASLKRHLAEFEKGNDIDEESGLLHITHAAWNAMALISHYKYHPNLDNRFVKNISSKKIGLDIDEVICDWVSAWKNYWDIKEEILSWSFDRKIHERFELMKKDNVLDNFYMSLKPLILPEELPFTPEVYITSRPVSTEVTKEWLDRSGFPQREVITVEKGSDKYKEILNLELDFFIDDKVSTFVDINTKTNTVGILMSRSHNDKFNAGYKRISDFNDFKNKFLL